MPSVPIISVECQASTISLFPPYPITPQNPHVIYPHPHPWTYQLMHNILASPKLLLLAPTSDPYIPPSARCLIVGPDLNPSLSLLSLLCSLLPSSPTPYPAVPIPSLLGCTFNPALASFLLTRSYDRLHCDDRLVVLLPLPWRSRLHWIIPRKALDGHMSLGISLIIQKALTYCSIPNAGPCSALLCADTLKNLEEGGGQRGNTYNTTAEGQRVGGLVREEGEQLREAKEGVGWREGHRGCDA